MSAFELAAVVLAVVFILIGGYLLAGAVVCQFDPDPDEDAAGALFTASVICWVIAALAAGAAVL